MRTYRNIMYALSTVPFFSGILEIILGTRSQNIFGAEIPADLLINAFMENQFRFIATAWFGYALFIWIFVNDIEKYGLPLDVLKGLMIFGGLTRIVSFIQFGFPSSQLGTTFLIVAGAVEVLFVPYMIVLRRRLVNGN